MRLFMSRSLDKIKTILDYVVNRLWSNQEYNDVPFIEEKPKQRTTSKYRPYNELYVYHFSDDMQRRGTITIIQNKDRSTTLLPTGRNQDISKRCLIELEDLIRRGIVQWFDFYSNSFDYQVKLTKEQLKSLINSLKMVAKIVDSTDNSYSKECQYGSYRCRHSSGECIHTLVSNIGDKLVLIERMADNKIIVNHDKSQDQVYFIVQIQGKEALLHKELIRALALMK